MVHTTQHELVRLGRDFAEDGGRRPARWRRVPLSAAHSGGAHGPAHRARRLARLPSHVRARRRFPLVEVAPPSLRPAPRRHTCRQEDAQAGQSVCPLRGHRLGRCRARSSGAHLHHVQGRLLAQQRHVGAVRLRERPPRRAAAGGCDVPLHRVAAQGHWRARRRGDRLHVRQCLHKLHRLLAEGEVPRRRHGAARRLGAVARPFGLPVVGFRHGVELQGRAWRRIHPEVPMDPPAAQIARDSRHIGVASGP
mmetsp:Transcript_79906/g.231959  ORF Transcript_79906/g.231959 Transcript_79906/m.231959 type:complete len:251 (+) Transcript_79906:156-908(+)